MKRLWAIPVAMAVACGGSGSFQENAASALPNKDSVQMSSPGNSSTALRASEPGTALTTDTGSKDATSNDAFYGLTVTVAVMFNVPVAVFLDLISNVAQQPPTSCTPTSCTWGPGSGPLDPNTYELTVSQDADGVSYDWALSGQPKSKPGSPFIQVVSGVAKPSGSPHHGSGSFTMDFDAAAQLDGTHTGQGKLVVSSYSNVGPAQLAVTFTGAQDGTHPTQIDNLAYSYAENASGGGDLQVAVHNTTTGDDFSVHSRWKNDGSGRADVQGQGSGTQVSLSDCWGAAPFTQVYFTSTLTVSAPPFGGPTTGSESACAFTPAAYSTLTAP
jgi:hypothetical protein